jgi:predicted transcriptional regulator
MPLSFINVLVYISLYNRVIISGLVASGYEVAEKEVIPAVRLALIKEMREKYRIKESQISEYIGITQAAISKYLSGKYSEKVRAMEAKLDKQIIGEYTKEIMNGKKDALNRCICTLCSNVNGFECEFSSVKESRV